MTALTVTELLGGKKFVGRNLENKMDFLEVSTKGLTISSLEHLTKYLNFTKKEIAKLISISPRNLQRYKDNEHLNINVSEHILKLAEIISKGVSVFGNKEKLISWLYSPNLTLSNKKPFDLLESQYGIEMILDELIRIEYGVFS